MFLSGKKGAMKSPAVALRIVPLIVLLFIFMGSWSGGLHAKSLRSVIRAVKRGNPNALAAISARDMQKLHSYKGEYYYISRKIGQRAVRSLFGCLKNSSTEVKRLCADNLYQMKLTYVHKKLALYYLQREDHAPTKLALQDLLVRIDAGRFAEARKHRDGNFLAKLSYDEIVDFEKGVPGGEFGRDDFNFLRGGTRNTDSRMRVYAVKILGRLPGAKSRALRLLRRLKRKEGDSDVLKTINESIGCQRNPSSCPDTAH